MHISKFLRRPLSYPEEGLRQIFCRRATDRPKLAALLLNHTYEVIKLIMTHTTAKITTPAQQSKCETCSKFNNYNESNARGWCNLFDKPARKNHQLTSDCQNALDSEELTEILSTHNAFLKPTIRTLAKIFCGMIRVYFDFAFCQLK